MIVDFFAEYTNNSYDSLIQRQSNKDTPNKKI